MKISHLVIVFLRVAVSTPAADEPGWQTNQTAKPLPHSWVDDKTEVTCKPAYYRRASDGLLVPVEEARQTENLMVSGVVLTVIEPKRLEGQVLSFHFDYGAEKWDHWYKADLLYSGVIPTACIGRLLFLCDPGFTNRPPGAPNPQGAANGRQPVRSETNRTPAAAASRGSP
jgi:hypothetical protein